MCQLPPDAHPVGEGGHCAGADQREAPHRSGTCSRPLVRRSRPLNPGYSRVPELDVRSPCAQGPSAEFQAHLLGLRRASTAPRTASWRTAPLPAPARPACPAAAAAAAALTTAALAPATQAWRRQNHPSGLWMALERAGSGRQDLTFDAAVPIFINRPILARFLASLAMTPGAEKNIFEHYL